jgi:hypothetical protein
MGRDNVRGGEANRIVIGVVNIPAVEEAEGRGANVDL